jgi:hypothetical protein
MGHAGFLGKWGGEREGKNSGKIFQKSPSPLSLHLQGRRSCTVPFKTAPCSFFLFFFFSFIFFLRKGKQNLGVNQNWVMTIGSSNYSLTSLDGPLMVIYFD